MSAKTLLVLEVYSASRCGKDRETGGGYMSNGIVVTSASYVQQARQNSTLQDDNVTCQKRREGYKAIPRWGWRSDKTTARL